MDRVCRDCGGPVSRQSKGRCKPCQIAYMQSDPEIAERRRAAIKRHCAQPEVKSARALRLRNYLQNMPESDREKRREHGRRQYRDCLSRPDVVAKTLAPEVRRRAGRARTDTVLAWCPPELRETYRELIRRNGLSASDARAALEPSIPGTVAHAKLTIENFNLKQKLRVERQQREAY